MVRPPVPMAPGIGLPLVVDAAKRDLSAVVERGRQQMLAGDYDAAVQHFTAALDLKPGLMNAFASRGYCHLTLGQEDKAHILFNIWFTISFSFASHKYHRLRFQDIQYDIQFRVITTNGII